MIFAEDPLNGLLGKLEASKNCRWNSIAFWEQPQSLNALCTLPIRLDSFEIQTLNSWIIKSGDGEFFVCFARRISLISPNEIHSWIHPWIPESDCHLQQVRFIDQRQVPFSAWESTRGWHFDWFSLVAEVLTGFFYFYWSLRDQQNFPEFVNLFSGLFVLQTCLKVFFRTGAFFADSGDLHFSRDRVG